jgi:hypothetical protein
MAHEMGNRRTFDPVAVSKPGGILTGEMRHTDALYRGAGRGLFERFAREVAAAGLPAGPDSTDVVSAAEVAALPETVQRYLSFMGVIGAPRHWSFTARFKGRFRLRPGLGWMPAAAWQYNSAVGVARIFVMRIRFASVVPMTGVDSYLRGRGRMLGKLLGVVTVADGRGSEFDIGELTTYLNDALLLAPSLLLRPGTDWKQLDEVTFEVTLTDRGHRVSGRVTIDERGAPVDFVTTDRFADLPGGLRRAEWHTPIRGWGEGDGQPRPESVGALWRLPEGDLSYIEGRIVDIAYDEVPLAAPAADGRHRLRRAGLGAAQIAAVLPAAPLLRRWYNHWGATSDEAATPLPGDELVPDVRMSSTRAVTIHAPPAQVWPWLAQIGQGRGGFYRYDELANLVGCHIHSTHQILAEYQQLGVGDVIRLAGEGGPSYRVERAEPPNLLVLVAPSTDRAAPQAKPAGSEEFMATWQWSLGPVDDGAQTRLVVRQRYQYPRSQSILWHLIEPVDFVMEKRMLHGIKSRAEKASPRVG